MTRSGVILGRRVGPHARPAEVGAKSWAYSGFFLVIVALYGSLGHDIFFNSLKAASADDPIAAVIVYVRLSTCLLATVVVAMSCGLGGAIAAVPKAFVPYICLALSSAMWAEQTKEVLRSAIVLLALYVAVTLLFSRLNVVTIARILLQIMAAVLIASAALAILVPAIGQHGAGDVLQGGHAGRWRGIFLHKNGLGPWAAFGTVLFWTHARFCRGPAWYWWGARGAALLCLIFSGSATSLLGALSLVATAVVLRLRREMGTPFAATLAALALLIAILVLGVASDQVFALLGRDPSLTGRTALWTYAWDYIQSDAPWFGHGYQSLGGPDFLAVEARLIGQVIPGPEDTYLATLLDLGIVGSALFYPPVLWVLGRSIAVLPRIVDADDRRAVEMMSLILCAALAMGVTETTPFVCTSFDGPVCFAALLALLVLPVRRLRSAATGSVALGPGRPLMSRLG